MNLHSFASKPIWPQVLAVAHSKLERLSQLHCEVASASKGLLQRLERLFEDSGLVPKGSAPLDIIPDSDFVAIERPLDELQHVHQIHLADCAVNFTGGNKLMANIAFWWAARRSLTALTI